MSLYLRPPASQVWRKHHGAITDECTCLRFSFELWTPLTIKQRAPWNVKTHPELKGTSVRDTLESIQCTFRNAGQVALLRFGPRSRCRTCHGVRTLHHVSRRHARAAGRACDGESPRTCRGRARVPARADLLRADALQRRPSGRGGALARRFVAVFDGYEAIVTPSGSCAAHVRTTSRNSCPTIAGCLAGRASSRSSSSGRCRSTSARPFAARSRTTRPVTRCDCSGSGTGRSRSCGQCRGLSSSSSRMRRSAADSAARSPSRTPRSRPRCSTRSSRT